MAPIQKKSPLAFHALSPEYTLKRARMRDLILHYDSVSHFDSLV